MALASSTHLVEHLCRLQLLDEQQQRELTALACSHENTRQLARDLIRLKWLTPFQAQHLLQDRGDELKLGPYVLIDRLGEGGMGQVFKARQRTMGRLVALKVIRNEVLINPIVIARFEREVQAAARLQHPNVVRALDAGYADGKYYLAMEFLQGADLFQLVKKFGPLPVQQACDYIRQAALGLQHAHDGGLIHRDIKPANLLVTNKTAASSAALPRPGSSAMLRRPDRNASPWGTVKILDFGLARLRDAHTETSRAALTQLGAIMGTPDYLAPEQASGNQVVDIRADLYSLGCTLYFLLSGRVPFPGGTLPEKLVHHQMHEPVPVEQARQEQLKSKATTIPADVVTLLERLTAKAPDERMQTPAELAVALERLQQQFAHQRPVPAVPLDELGEPLIAAEPASATFIVAAPGKAARPWPTQRKPQRGRPAWRHALLGIGFLVCCAVSGRWLPHGAPRVAGETPPPRQASVRSSAAATSAPNTTLRIARRLPANAGKLKASG